MQAHSVAEELFTLFKCISKGGLELNNSITESEKDAVGAVKQHTGDAQKWGKDIATPNHTLARHTCPASLWVRELIEGSTNV